MLETRVDQRHRGRTTMACSVHWIRSCRRQGRSGKGQRGWCKQQCVPTLHACVTARKPGGMPTTG
eukprot:scaffold323708_cov19-Tisochrysis_lutea.AAC.1